MGLGAICEMQIFSSNQITSHRHQSRHEALTFHRLLLVPYLLMPLEGSLISFTRRVQLVIHHQLPSFNNIKADALRVVQVKYIMDLALSSTFDVS